MNDERPVTLKPACIHLRHKMMYVDVRQATPGLVDDASDTTVYFCTRTQDALGPDHEPVGPADCSRARSCFCPGP
jgi:hypothetical protein